MTISNAQKLTSDEFLLFMLGWESQKAYVKGLDKLDGYSGGSTELIELWFDRCGHLKED